MTQTHNVINYSVFISLSLLLVQGIVIKKYFANETCSESLNNQFFIIIPEYILRNNVLLKLHFVCIPFNEKKYISVPQKYELNGWRSVDDHEWHSQYWEICGSDTNAWLLHHTYRDQRSLTWQEKIFWVKILK